MLQNIHYLFEQHDQSAHLYVAGSCFTVIYTRLSYANKRENLWSWIRTANASSDANARSQNKRIATVHVAASSFKEESDEEGISVISRDKASI